MKSKIPKTPVCGVKVKLAILKYFEYIGLSPNRSI